MTIAIVHYHLGPGGVSQVIIATSRFLAAAGIRHVILVGAAPPPLLADLPIRVVRGLEYESLAEVGLPSLPAWIRSIEAAAIDALGAAPDVWHFHNHSLGKNKRVLELVAHLANSGGRILLQIHDLAEDGRPENYPALTDAPHGMPYPLAERIHYGFINSRDQQAFIKAGLPPERSAVLVNPISFPEAVDLPPSGDPLVLAPVRGIRRKNIGELVLLAALAPSGTRFAITQAPHDPMARQIHDKWQRFSRAHQIPIDFEVVGHVSPQGESASTFEAWVRRSTHWITTSVSEGFGLAFLQAAAHRRPLIGRQLPYLADDHAKQGVVAGNLYDQLLIPEEWVEKVRLKDHLLTTLERNGRFYQKQVTDDVFEETFSALVENGSLDFGNLPEAIQQAVIEKAMSPGLRRTPEVASPKGREPVAVWLERALRTRECSVDPARLAPWSPENAGLQLEGIYRHLMEMPCEPLGALDRIQILDSYTSPHGFHFLKSAPSPAIPGPAFRAVIFDIYGTLLIAPAGGVRVDEEADENLRRIIKRFGWDAPESPSTAVTKVVGRHHVTARMAGNPYPEVDLRESWREALGLDEATPTHDLVVAIESAWHPAAFMPGAVAAVQNLSAAGLLLGIVSNAQCNTRHAFGDLWDLFTPGLIVLSYQHGIAKPCPQLFERIRESLDRRGIRAEEALFIGNDPLHDVVPAAAQGFKTALFVGHPASFRPGECTPDYILNKWSDISSIIFRRERISDR